MTQIALGEVQGTATMPQRVRSFPGLGVVPMLWRDPARGLVRLYEEYGPVFEAKLPTGNVCFAIGVAANQMVFRKRPDALTAHDQLDYLKGRAVGTLDGKEHERVRVLMQKPLNGDGLAAIGPLMARISEATVREWSEVSALEASRVLAMETVLRAGLGAAAADLRRLERLYATFARAFFLPRLRFPGSPLSRGLKARREIDAWLQRRIQEARTDGPGDDLTGALVAAMHGRTDPLTETEVVDNLRITVVAGQETTANVMSAMLIQLALERELWAELCAAVPRGTPLPGSPREATQFKLARAIVKESLRRFTPAWIVLRQVLVDDFVVERCHLPRGTMVAVSPLATQHLPELWQRPFEFDVARWSDESAIPHGGYVPFGGGSHVCVGAALVTLELIQLLVALASARRRPELAGRHDVRPYLLPFPHVSRKVRLRFVEES
jgi:cytochrome P450 family 117 subfamily A